VGSRTRKEKEEEEEEEEEEENKRKQHSPHYVTPCTQTVAVTRAREAGAQTAV
jgi:hypothetical protein